MATMVGGTTIDTVGLTAQENTTLTNLLQTNFSTATTPTTVTIPAAPTIPGGIGQTNVLVGSFEATSVQNVTLASSETNSISILSSALPTGASKTITNVVADENTGGVIFDGKNISTNSITGFIAGSNTSLVVGNAGTQIIDGSRSTQNLQIITGTGNDTVVGGIGNDSVSFGDVGIGNGGSGADTLIGGTGTATLGGGIGADSIVAATGGGVLIGEVGNDSLVGGAGKDVFIYRTGDGNDAITGFNPAADTLALAISGVDLTSIINNATVSGGNTIITMPDGSTITLAGVTGINVNWFTIK
jgi:serralysin